MGEISQSTRIKKLKGKFDASNFSKLLSQISGKAILSVVSINPNCKECERIQMLIHKMENGLIHKLPDLIMLYGYSSGASGRSEDGEDDTKDQGEQSENPKPVILEGLEWADHSDGHGFSIYLSEDNVMVQTGEFDHAEFKDVLLDYLRRFRSSVLTLADLEARRKFIENKKSGIIIETRSSTKTSEIMKLEEYIQARKNTVKIPIYFLKGVGEEMSYVVKGEYLLKQKGLNLQKFLKGVAKIAHQKQ